ncbi:MAG: lysostaphin resistance A-like protein, partial [Burkholderiales bacterium]
AGYLAWPALLVLGGLAAAAFAAKRGHANFVVRTFVHAALVTLAIGLAVHAMPGFNNPLLIENFRFSSDAAPYTHHANFDKAAAGLFVLVFLCNRVRQAGEWRDLLLRTYPIALLTCTVVIATGLAVGYSRPDFKLPAYTPVFLVVNLLFTCVAEEAFFRGFFQHRLAKYLQDRITHGNLVALASCSVLFGVVHLGGGPWYIVLATCAGLGYGYAYLRTQRLEASILVHFCVNAVHFIGFTYPRLA